MTTTKIGVGAGIGCEEIDLGFIIGSQEDVRPDI